MPLTQISKVCGEEAGGKSGLVLPFSYPEEEGNQLLHKGTGNPEVQGLKLPILSWLPNTTTP
jgi:hypothetical protein